METRRESRLLAIVTTVVTGVTILSGAIAVPLLCRPFYYAHIGPLHLTLRSRLPGNQIKETYGEVMDYCLGKSDVFFLSYLPWSEAGASHFADVRALFILDLRVAACSILVLIAIWIIVRFGNVRPTRLKGHTPGFWSAAGLGLAFLGIGGFAATDFNRFFIIFHSVFFPGKDNWIFDFRYDPVIQILPQTFFRNCALLVFGLIAGACALLVLHDYITKKRQQ